MPFISFQELTECSRPNKPYFPLKNPRFAEMGLNPEKSRDKTGAKMFTTRDGLLVAVDAQKHGLSVNVS